MRRCQEVRGEVGERLKVMTDELECHKRKDCQDWFCVILP